jgi:hypothetical protein
MLHTTPWMLVGVWCHNHARTRAYDTTHITPIPFLVTHTTLPVTRESAAAMQPTKPGVAYTQQSALVCATISLSVFVAPGAFPNERSIKGVGSQLEDPGKVPEERKATRGGVGEAVREQARERESEEGMQERISTHIYLFSAYCLHAIFLYVAKFTVRDAAFSLLIDLYLRLRGSVSKHCKGSLQHPIVTE